MCTDIRYPLLYRPLVELIHSTPWRLRFNEVQNRVLQRQALREILPEKIRIRIDKRGPDEAFLEGLRKSTVFHALLTDHPRIVERGYVDEKLWIEAVNQGKFGAVPSFPCFLAAICIEIWLRQMEKS